MIQQEIIGKKFGNYLILQDLGTREVGKYFNKKVNKIFPLYQRYFLCKCKCGAEKEIQSKHLKSAHSTQCRSCANKKSNLIHGMARTSEYNIWISMIQRCTNPKNKHYKDYGGRGITVCQRWLHSFENFYADMGKRPKGMSIDRINNDGNYEPGNCRWTDWSTQMKNRRKYTK